MTEFCVIPGVRTFVSLPAGIEKMQQSRSLAWTTAGSLLWMVILTIAGQALGEGYPRVGYWIGQVGHVLVPGLIGTALMVLLGMALRNHPWLRSRRR
jgi:membrane protein DedA with SNARE-associated domain